MDNGHVVGQGDSIIRGKIFRGSSIIRGIINSSGSSTNNVRDRIKSTDSSNNNSVPVPIWTHCLRQNQRNWTTVWPQNGWKRKPVPSRDTRRRIERRNINGSKARSNASTR